LKSDYIKIENIYGIGTYWNFDFFQKINKRKVQKRIHEIIEQFDQKYSRFKSDSNISRLNNERQFKNPDPEFQEILKLAKVFYLQTNKIFNIGIGEIIENRGYDSDYSFRKKDSNENIPNLLKLLNIRKSRISLDTTGRLDLGGYGKGFLIDKLAYIFKNELGIKYFLINGGGDIYVTSNNEESIEIFCESPLNSHEYIMKIKLKNSAIAASSTNRRRWFDKKTGEIFNHIVNTTNKKDIAHAFAIAESAVCADVAATVFMIEYDSDHANKIANKLGAKYICFDDNLVILAKNFKL
jgi:thiamine biosynthesis lipoprotein